MVETFFMSTYECGKCPLQLMTKNNFQLRTGGQSAQFTYRRLLIDTREGMIVSKGIDKVHNYHRLVQKECDSFCMTMYL
jgi:hypothetical protein